MIRICHLILRQTLFQAQSEDDDEVGENVPINMVVDGGKFMEEFFEQVSLHFHSSNILCCSFEYDSIIM